MTAVKEKAVQIIENMPDNEILYVLNILENINYLTSGNTRNADEMKKGRPLSALFGADVDTGFEIPTELDFAADVPRESL